MRVFGVRPSRALQRTNYPDRCLCILQTVSGEKKIVACIWAALLALFVAVSSSATPFDDQVTFHALQQDIRVAGILEDLRKASHAGLHVIRDVHVVDPVTATVAGGQSVVVSGSRIVWVGDLANEPRLENPIVIDGHDRYLSPGLVDMHVHSNSAADWLLNLANGVTAVRDMDGFPWLLKARDHINARKMLGPVDQVAGTIINANTLEGYAVMTRDSLNARRIVRQQAACGYDFIKVHNIVPEPIFDAVAEEAARLGMDLVGHVPHDISVRHAVQKGMRTMEHLKGFLNDATLQPGDTDFAAVVDGPDVWIVPTLYAGRGFAGTDTLRRYLAAPENRCVPLRKRAAWQAMIDAPQDASFRLNVQAQATMRAIMTRLIAAHARFLAGTDADNYPFQVMGYALVEELQLLQAAGLSPAEVIRSATSEPARAMRMEREAGQVRAGMRADLILLAQNPLLDPSAFKSNLGVMAHGIWLDRKELDSSLNRLADIYAEPDKAVPITRAAARAAFAEAEARSNAGFVFETISLQTAASALTKAGLPDLAARFTALADVPKNGPCAEILW